MEAGFSSMPASFWGGRRDCRKQLDNDLAGEKGRVLGSEVEADEVFYSIFYSILLHFTPYYIFAPYFRERSFSMFSAPPPHLR